MNKDPIIQSFRTSFIYMFLYGILRQITLKKNVSLELARLLTWIKYSVRHYFGPYIGILYQYRPKPIGLPSRYLETSKHFDSHIVISIVTPTYNYAHFLERTIKSVIYQGYPELEYVIQDGASTDSTIQLVEKFRHRLKHFESRRDNGQAHAVNLGFQHTSGEIMAYLNADDILLPGTLNYVADYFSAHPNVDVIYGHRLIIDENDNEIGDWIMPPHDKKILRWADYIPQETVFWRRRIWEKIGEHLDESFDFAMDWDLFLRFQTAGAIFERVPRFLAAFRVHPHQKTSSQLANLGKKEMARIRIINFGRQIIHGEVIKNVWIFLLCSIWHRWIHKAEIKRQKWLSLKDKPISLYEPESIYVYSLHKTGRSLFTHLLRNVSDRQHIDYETMLFENQLPKVVYEKYGRIYGVFCILGPDEYHTQPYIKLIKKISTTQFVKDKTIIFLIRDPRDVLISMYYSIEFSHVSSLNSQIENELGIAQNSIRNQSLDEFVLNYCESTRRKYEVLFLLSKQCKRGVIFKYENLIDHFDDFVKDLSKYITFPEQTKQDLYLVSRSAAQEDISAHKQNGKTEQYKEKLRIETIQYLNKALKDVLAKFDYI